MKVQEIGVALIGTGFMGAVHTEALKRVGVRLVGILGSSPEKSKNAAAALGYMRGYATLDALLADPEVHAVHVNTPNRLHLSQTLACLAVGKHVLCEKPLGMDSVESAALRPPPRHTLSLPRASTTTIASTHSARKREARWRRARWGGSFT